MTANYDHFESELIKLRESYDEVVNKLFNIEKEMLLIRKKDMVTADQMKSLRDELDLCRFENDHMVCLLEGKESEIKEMRNLLGENDRLLDKYRARYSSSLEKYEKMFGELKMHLEKFPEPCFIDSMKCEIEQLRQENLELIKRNGHLEEQLKDQAITGEQRHQGLANYMKSLTDKLERANNNSISEILNNFQKIEGQMIVLENEAIDWQDKYEQFEEKYNELLIENFALRKQVDEFAIVKTDIGQANCDKNETNCINIRSTIPYSKQKKTAMEIESPPHLHSSDRPEEDVENKKKSVVPVKPAKNKNAAMKNNCATSLYLVICSGCGFNISKKDRTFECIQCAGRITRQVSPRMLWQP